MSGSGGIPLTTLTPDERAEWFEELNRYQSACGCDIGAIGCVSASVLVVVWQLSTMTTLTLGRGLFALAMLTAAAVAGGVLGKMYGLARARSRFRRVTARLIARHQAGDLRHVEMHPVG
jgi:hypothetical protein